MSDQKIEAIKEKALSKLGSVLPAPEQKSTHSFFELWEARDEVQEFIIDDLIPQKAVILFIGVDGIGKTQLMSQLCMTICLNIPHFLGLKLNPMEEDERNCLVVATEDSKQKFTSSVMKVAFALDPNLDPKKVGLDFCEATDFDSLDTLLLEIDLQCRKKKRKLIILDAFSDVFTLINGEINSNTDARLLLSRFQAVCKNHNTTLIIVHHAAKSKMVAKQKEGKIFVEKDDSQGAGAITQKSRTVLALTNDPKSLSSDGKTYKNYLHVVKANVMGKKYQAQAIEAEFHSETLLHNFTGLVEVELMQRAVAGESQDAVQLDNKRRKDGPREYSDNEHKLFLKKMFEGQKELSRAKIIELMTQIYQVGKSKVEQKGGFLHYLKEEKEFISCPRAGVYHITAAGARIVEGWVPVDESKGKLFIAKDDEELPEAPF